MGFASSIGKYRLGRTIGEGTFAKVKLAVNNLNGQQVAIKILDKKMVMIIPESKEILIHPKQKLSDQQREQMANGLKQGFKWEVFK